MQSALVILIVAACAVWLGVLAYRYFRAKPGAQACAGGCCGGHQNKPAPPPGAAPAPRTLMISSDDLRARLKVRPQRAASSTDH